MSEIGGLDRKNKNLGNFPIIPKIGGRWPNGVMNFLGQLYTKHIQKTKSIHPILGKVATIAEKEMQNLLLRLTT